MASTNYSCGRCGGSVRKNAAICPHCGAHLSGIRCRKCGFSGTISDFTNDRCPKCGSIVVTTTQQKCPKCGIIWDGFYCLNCGHRTSWFWLIVVPLISFLFLSIWVAYGVMLIISDSLQFNKIIELLLMGIVPVGMFMKSIPPLINVIQARRAR